MTNKEAIKYFSDNFPDYVFEYPSDKQLAFNKAIKALENAEKYKWHDLRKNPEDLPEIGYPCIAWFDSADVFSVTRYEDTWVYNELYELREMQKEDSCEIVGWRYIEPME